MNMQFLDLDYDFVLHLLCMCTHAMLCIFANDIGLVFCNDVFDKALNMSRVESTKGL